MAMAEMVIEVRASDLAEVRETFGAVGAALKDAARQRCLGYCNAGEDDHDDRCVEWHRLADAAIAASKEADGQESNLLGPGLVP